MSMYHRDIGMHLGWDKVLYTMIDFQIPRANQELQAILNNRYIKMDVNRMKYTIVGRKDVERMQQNLMGRTNNSSVY